MPPVNLWFPPGVLNVNRPQRHEDAEAGKQDVRVGQEAASVGMTTFSPVALNCELVAGEIEAVEVADD